MSWRILLISNVVLFQVAWLACIMTASTELHWLATVIVACLVALHCRMAAKAKNELKLVMIALLLGLVWESLLVYLDVLRYPQGQVHAALAPHWIIAMWALFATQLNVSMRWLKNNYRIALLFGAIGGPLSFLAGARLNAVVMPEEMVALMVLSLGWAILMPAMLFASTYYDGYQGRGMANVR